MFLIWRHLMFPNFEHYAKILKNQSRLYITVPLSHYYSLAEKKHIG